MADISITAANFITSANASLIQGTAGATLTRGQPLYYDSASGTYKLYVATSTTTDTFVGFACEDAAAGQVFLIVTKDPALQLGGTLAVGDTVWLSLSGVTKTFADLVSTWRIYTIGVCTATSSNVVNFDPVRGGVK
jgi:hypothetical protein